MISISSSAHWEEVKVLPQGLRVMGISDSSGSLLYFSYVDVSRIVSTTEWKRKNSGVMQSREFKKKNAAAQHKK